MLCEKLIVIMNKKIYVGKQAGNWGRRVAKGLSRCGEASRSYAACASSQGLGIEYRVCQQEFTQLMHCLKANLS